MKLRYSERAIRDLQAIGDWIAVGNPDRAVTFVQELRAVCRKLTDFPQAFPRVDERRNLHRCIYRKRVIYYRVTAAELVITAIVHAARDQSGRF